MQSETIEPPKAAFVRLPPHLHRKLRIISIEENTSLQRLLLDAVEEIVRKRETA